MSLGCGTLASPSGFRRGNTLASSGNGKQHTLPANPEHRRINQEDVENYWVAKQTKSPSRLWGSVEVTDYSGEALKDGQPHLWTRGEYWNVDSNITNWGEHEVRRNAAAANHDVHRHDQITRCYLPSQRPGGKDPMQTVDGEAWGFDLGSRDRQGKLAPREGQPRWKPVRSCEQFRAERSYDRNLERMTTHFRTLRTSTSSPGSIQAVRLLPEDVGGEAGELVNVTDLAVERAGRTHGSRSCLGWDGYDHAVKREGAKLSLGVHAPSLRANREAYPFKDNELQPSAIYTRRFKKGGEQALRKYEPRNVRLPMR